MEGALSGQPTECRYCRYPGTKGHCYGNHFGLSVGYNLGCMIASDMLFDSWGGFLGSSCLLVALYSFAVAAAGTAPGG